MVGKTGFEPATSWPQTKRSTKLSYFPDSLMNSLLVYYTTINLPCQPQNKKADAEKPNFSPPLPQHSFSVL
jgi:hypothetical protein